MVVQPKPRFTNISEDDMKPNMIHACIDQRIPNKHMERNRISPGPVVEDFMYKFYDCITFSKLDLRSGYNPVIIVPRL